MGEECTATSAIITSSSPTSHGWWEMFHSSSTTASNWHHHQNPNSNLSNSNTNCDQDDVLSISTSLTNASNHSVLTVDHESSGGGGRQLVEQPPVPAPPPSPTATDFIAEHASDNHLWTHVLSSVGSNGDLRSSSQDVAENLFEAISSKASSPGIIFEPSACDYLKKIDTNHWEIFPNPSSLVFNSFVKNLNGYNTSDHDHDHHHHNQSSIESERLTKLSNLVGNWSIAPPNPELNNLHNFHHHHHFPLTNPSPMDNYSHPTLIKNPVFLSCYAAGGQHHDHDHGDVKMEQAEATLDHVEAPTSYLRRAFKGSNLIINPNNSSSSNGSYRDHHSSLINNNSSISSMEAADNFYGSSMSTSSSCTSSMTYSRLSKPLVDNIHASNIHCFRPLNNLSDHPKKQGLQAPTSLQKQMQTSSRSSNGRTQGIEGKKKRGEEMSSDTVLKKPKHESSTASSSVKVHSPKVKLGDRITALQQIVSPFGKTDTASVLLEAIGYINFLQEQVQLLSNPYMKPNSHKDPWGSLDRKDQKGDMKMDLKGRGLCLVPISCTPQIYHETTGSDYWTPTYRGCLYR